MTRQIPAIARAKGVVLAFLLTLSALASAQDSLPGAQELQDSARADSRAQQEYESNRLGLFVGADARANAKSAGRWTLAYVGKDMKPLEGTAFYKKIGRQDLALAYERKETLKTILSVTGGILVSTGLFFELAVAAMPEPGHCTPTDSFGACAGVGIATSLYHARLPMALIGLGVIGGGFGLLLWSYSIDPNPVNAAQPRRLVDEYNEQLKLRLGLSPEKESIPTLRIAVSPVISRSGGGLSMQLSF